MKLNRREKILACAAGGLIAAIAVWLLLVAGDGRSAGKLRTERSRLAAEVDGKQNLLEAAARDAKRLAAWQHRALPADPVVARSLYQNWLRSLANRVNFRHLNVESKEAESRRDAFTRISFSIHAQASLAELTEVLYEFYSAGPFHQIRRMDVKPQENSRDLDVNLAVEALSLPGADAKDHLCKEPGHGLRLAKLADYRVPIVARNLFAPYAPPMKEKTNDVAEYAFITAFIEVAGSRQVWLQDRTADKTWRLAEGATFEVGGVRGTVQTIAPTREVVVDFDGHRRRLHDGDNLRGGVEVPK